MVLRIVVALLIVATAGVYARVLGAHRVASGRAPDLHQLPSTLGAWRSRDIALSDNVSDVLGADATLQRIYRHSTGSEVQVFIAYFGQQKVNSQIHSPRHCVPGSGWKIVSAEPAQLDLPGGPRTATRMIIERQGNSQELLYWFQTRSGTVRGEYALKLDLMKNSLARRPTDAAFVRYIASTRNRKALSELMASLEPEVDRLLREAGLP